MTTVNFDTYKDLTYTVADLSSSLTHDGSAIVAGSEPLLVPDMAFGNRWSIELFLKTSSLARMCIFSIPDGTGVRYMDVHIVGNDTILVYYEGVETSYVFTTTPVPLDTLFNITIGYDRYATRFQIGGNASTDGVAADVFTLTTTVNLTVANTTEISLMKPVHADADYFNGSFGALRMRNNYHTINNATYTANISVVLGWIYDSNYIIVNFDGPPFYQATKVDSNRIGVYKPYHSLTRYNATQAVACISDLWYGGWTKKLGFFTAPQTFAVKFAFGNHAAAGMHYFKDSDSVLLVNRDSFNIQMVNIAAETNTVINNGGQYKACRGDPDDEYLFGWKVAADGTNQLFRMDPDGTNEITTDVFSILGVNEGVLGFGIDDDGRRVFFHDVSTKTLRSVDYDLTVGSFYTWSIGFYDSNSGNIDYSQGYIYYGGVIQATRGYNNSFYRYELSTETADMYGGVQHSIRAGQEGTTALFIHRDRNEMIVSTEGAYMSTFTGTNFDYHIVYMSAEAYGFGEATVSWTPVDGATSYNLLQDGVVVQNTTATSVLVSGLGQTGIKYKYTLESSTDDVVYGPVIYYKISYTALSKFWKQTYPVPANFGTFSACLGLLDPYDPYEMVYSGSAGLFAYNITTDTNRVLTTYNPNIEQNYIVSRSWTNKRFYFTPIDDKMGIYDAGSEGSRLNEFSTLVEFMADTKSKVFTHTEPIRYIRAAFHKALIYYSGTVSFDLRSVNLDGTDDKVILTAGNIINGIGIDPYDSNSIVYTSANHIWHADISQPATPVITQITSSNPHRNTNDLQILNGVLYGQYWNTAYPYGLFTIKIDGSEYYQVNQLNAAGGEQWTLGRNFAINPTDKTVTMYDRTASTTVLYDTSISVLPEDPSLLLVRATPLGISLNWSGETIATSYRIGLSLGEDGENTISSKASGIPSTTFSHKIRSTLPGTVYTVYLYYSTVLGGSENILISAKTITTPGFSGSADDFEVDFFENESGNGGFDLSSLSTANLSLISDVLNDLFQSGDEINVKLPSGKKVKTKMVRRGDSVTLDDDNSSISIPFTTTAGTGQSVSMTLGDATVVTVAFDELTEELTVNGSSYSGGDSFVLDGKKVTVVDI